MAVKNLAIIVFLGCMSVLSACGDGGAASRSNTSNEGSNDNKNINNNSRNKKTTQARQERLSYRIEEGKDDAQQNTANGTVSLTGNALALGDNDKSLVALRFNGIEIPKGTPIVDAYIQFSVHKTNDSTGNNSMQISVEDADNSAAFASTDQNLSNRTSLGNIAWNINTSWKSTVHERGKNQRTPNLKELVQQIVNKEGWKKGNSISFLLKGDGLRNAISYEGSMKVLEEVNDLAANLVITLPSLQEFKPNAGSDDAEENLSTGKVETDGADLELGWETDSKDSAQRVGIRFANVNITPKSKIHRAYIQFTQDEAKNHNPFEVTIQAEDSDNPDTFLNEDKNLSKRKLISESVSWSSTDNWVKLHESGEKQRTPDLKEMVQTLVNNPQWKVGNAMAFFIEGKGTRTAESFEGGPDKSPKLVVEYTNASTPVVFDKLRLVWRDDPTSTISIIWNKHKGSNGEVHYDEYKNGECPTDINKYSQKQAPHRSNGHFWMRTVITRLENLKPDTAYRFIIKNDAGMSECSWFRTAPNTAKAFSYISGGDTKSSGKALEIGRWSNKMVSKVRPLFVFFTGDFNSGLGLNADSWKQWLNDWSNLTRSEDGRVYPLIPGHGNHENGDFEALYKLFDTGNSNPDTKYNKYAYNAHSFGGNLLYLINLNSEIRKAPLDLFRKHDEKQTKWLEKRLKEAQGHSLRVVGYHKPMRPHTRSKREGKHLSDNWAPLFEKYNVHVAYESDTHNHKITYPVRSANRGEANVQGFVRDDNNGVMYVGEGSWGALPRSTDDDKSWTFNSAAINQIKLNRVYPASGRLAARLDISVIKVAQKNDKGQMVNYVEGVREREKAKPMALPKGVTLHKTKHGDTVSVPFKAKTN